MPAILLCQLHHYIIVGWLEVIKMSLKCDYNVELLHSLFSPTLCRDVLMQHGVCVRVLGDLHMLPRDVMVAVARAVNYTKENTRWASGDTGQESAAAQPLHHFHSLQCLHSRAAKRW